MDNYTTVTSLHGSNVSSEDFLRSYYIAGNVASGVSVIGILANLLNVVVLCKMLRKRTTSPTYHLLLSLGVADLMVLLFYSIQSFVTFSRYPPLLWTNLSEEHSNFEHILSRTWYFPVNVFLLASNWSIVAVTVFRFLAVIKPIKVSQWCTLQRVRITIVAIYIIAILINIPDWFTVRFTVFDDGRIRGSDTDLYNKISMYYTLYQVVEMVIPILMNSVLVSVIITSLCRTRHDLTDSMTDRLNIHRQKENRRISVMLVAIVIWFLICFIPQSVYIIYRDYSGSTRLDNEKKEVFQLFGIISQIFLLLNHSANVFLYCLVNKNYRRNVLTSLGCKKDLVQAMTTMSRLATMYKSSPQPSSIRKLPPPETPEMSAANHRLLLQTNNQDYTEYEDDC